jgi:hypothetical protein
MSASSSVGDFDLNVVKLRKPLDASGQDILNVGTLEVNTQIQLTPAGNTVNFLGEINQVTAGAAFAGNKLTNTTINTGEAEGSNGLSVRDVGAVNGLYVLPNSPNNLFNPLVNAGDVSVVGTSASATLTLSNNQSTTNGVKITGQTMTMGVGGTGDTPTNRVVFNNPVNTISATTVSGMTIQSTDISPTPTLKVKETSTNNALIIVPKSDGGQYNPLDTATAVEMVAQIDGTSADNGQQLAIVPHSATSCGVRMVSGTAGSGTNAYLEVGCGGTGVDPSQRIRFNNATNQLQMTYTGLSITTGALPTTAGAALALFLPVTINGTPYKIELNANNPL